MLRRQSDVIFFHLVGVLSCWVGKCYLRFREGNIYQKKLPPFVPSSTPSDQSNDERVRHRRLMWMLSMHWWMCTSSAGAVTWVLIFPEYCFSKQAENVQKIICDNTAASSQPTHQPSSSSTCGLFGNVCCTILVEQILSRMWLQQNGSIPILFNHLGTNHYCVAGQILGQVRIFRICISRWIEINVRFGLSILFYQWLF